MSYIRLPFYFFFYYVFKICASLTLTAHPRSDKTCIKTCISGGGSGWRGQEMEVSGPGPQGLRGQGGTPAPTLNETGNHGRVLSTGHCSC